MNCKGCHVKIESDGHGELVHVNADGTPGKYGCTPKAKPSEPYPVAH